MGILMYSLYPQGQNFITSSVRLLLNDYRWGISPFDPWMETHQEAINMMKQLLKVDLLFVFSTFRLTYVSYRVLCFSMNET